VYDMARSQIDADSRKFEEGESQDGECASDLPVTYPVSLKTWYPMNAHYIVIE